MMGVNCTKMGKTKLITPTPAPSAMAPLPKTVTTSDYGATNRAPPSQRQPSALSSNGDIMWEELEKELQENNLR